MKEPKAKTVKELTEEKINELKIAKINLENVILKYNLELGLIEKNIEVLEKGEKNA